MPRQDSRSASISTHGVSANKPINSVDTGTTKSQMLVASEPTEEDKTIQQGVVQGGLGDERSALLMEKQLLLGKVSDRHDGLVSSLIKIFSVT